MKYALFPGCVLDGAAAEAYTSLKKVCERLDAYTGSFLGIVSYYISLLGLLLAKRCSEEKC
ncbi:MAG: hypothetical protein ACFNYA_07080 [Capnocytophaga granulosa]